MTVYKINNGTQKWETGGHTTNKKVQVAPDMLGLMWRRRTQNHKMGKQSWEAYISSYLKGRKKAKQEEVFKKCSEYLNIPLHL